MNCSTCSCSEKDREFKIEVDFRDDFLNKKSHQNNFSEAPSSILALDNIKQKEPYIIKIQSLWRGYQVRKQIPIKKKSSEYFDNNYKGATSQNSVKREEREPFKFKNGAFYTGQ